MPMGIFWRAPLFSSPWPQRKPYLSFRSTMWAFLVPCFASSYSSTGFNLWFLGWFCCLTHPCLATTQHELPTILFSLHSDINVWCTMCLTSGLERPAWRDPFFLCGLRRGLFYFCFWSFHFLFWNEWPKRFVHSRYPSSL